MSTCPSGSPNRSCASISSRPLFIMVAESMEILSPMSQLGWASACSGVTSAMSASDQLRNGPPDAVRMSRSTAPMLVGFEDLEDGVVLGVHRQEDAAGLLDGVDQQASGADQGFLVGQRHHRAAPRRRDRRCRPANPTTAAITHSAGRSAASMTASGPAATSIDVPASAAFSAWKQPGSATTATRAFRPPRLLGQQFHRAAGPRGLRRDSSPDHGAMRSTVLCPTDPVEPRIVMRRGFSGDGAVHLLMPRATSYP